MPEKTLDQANIDLATSNEMQAKASAIRLLVDCEAFTTDSIVAAVAAGDVALLEAA